MKKIILLLLLFLVSCSTSDDSIKNVAQKDSLLIKQYLGQSSNIWIDEGYTVLTKSINSVKKMKMITDTLVNNSETGDISFSPLTLFMYDSSSGKETFNVKSLHGVSHQKNHTTVATENVELESRMEDKVMMLYTDSLIFLQDNDQVFTEPVYIKIFNSTMDTVLYVIKANKGVWNLSTLRSTLNENVTIEYKKDNVELLCEDLLFDSKEDIIESKGHVKFRRSSGDFVEGDGFVSDSKFKHWRLKNNIQGEIFNLDLGGQDL